MMSIVVFVNQAQCSLKDSIKGLPKESDITDDAWMQLEDEPSSTFLDTYVHFIDDNLVEASKALVKSATYVDLEMYRASGEIKKDLANTSKNLRKLAKEVSQGKIKGIASLQALFAESEYSLSAHHFKQAQDYEKQKKTVAFGKALNIARKHLRHAWAWSEWKLSEDEASDLEETTEIISELNNGNKDKMAKSKMPVQFLGDLIKKLGMKLKGKEK
jgi:hypothetical protein